MKALTRLGQRRYPILGGYTIEQARELAALSRSLSRQIGLVIDRKGRVEQIIVGTATAIMIPELARGRAASSRLRGVRLLHTHLTPDGLSHEDLTDLLFLRLDSLSVLTINDWGMPVSFQNAYLLPPGRMTNDKKPCAVDPLIPWDHVHTDFGAATLALEEEFGRVSDNAREAQTKTRAILVSVSTQPKAVQEQYLEELAELADSAGVVVAGTLIQKVAAIHPKHLLGEGKLAELEVLALQGQASTIIVDGELTPNQLNSLSELTERKVLDRTQLILDIFAQRATTRAGKLQVEMAQLNYTLPRLVGKNHALDRLAGGIGGRGPGETKLETDRRRIRERITRVKHELEAVRRQRATNRILRKKSDLPLAALVGYTNAGKSTLLNIMTRANVLVEDKLFATLDPTTRRLRVPSEREIVLADTVGFIRNLPKELIEAFRATLEELENADLLIHIVDASRKDMFQQMTAVATILADMGLKDIPRLLVLNKWDRLDKAVREALTAAYPAAVKISALTGFGLDNLSRRIASLLSTVDTTSGSIY